MENMGLGAGLGALGFWAFIAAVVIAGIWYAIREREAKHETLRRMIESDKAIDQALMEKLLSLNGGGSKRLDHDLKVSGLIVLFVAPGVALLGWFIGLQSEDVLLPLLGAAALIACVGIGLLVAAKSIERSYQEEDAAAPTLPTPPMA